MLERANIVSASELHAAVFHRIRRCSNWRQRPARKSLKRLTGKSEDPRHSMLAFEVDILDALDING